MLALGLTLGHDSGAALCSSGEILAAANEERLTRLKLETRFPERSIKTVLAMTGVNPEDISVVVWVGTVELHPKALNEMLRETELEKYAERSKSRLGDRLYYYQYMHSAAFHRKCLDVATSKIRQILSAEFGINAPLYRIDHHLAHAAAAFYTSGFEEALVVTADGQGDGIAGSIGLGMNGEFIKNIQRMPEMASIGFIYMFVTEALGFKSLQHEGKITGLAAYGNPDRYVDTFRKLVQTDDDQTPYWDQELLTRFLHSGEPILKQSFNQAVRFTFGWDKPENSEGKWRKALWEYIKAHCDPLEREDWSAALQRWTEEVTRN